MSVHSLGVRSVEYFLFLVLEKTKKISNFISTDIEWISLNSVKVSKEQEENLIVFFETLEDNDDVQNVFSNLELNIN